MATKYVRRWHYVDRSHWPQVIDVAKDATEAQVETAIDSLRGGRGNWYRHTLKRGEKLKERNAQVRRGAS